MSVKSLVSAGCPSFLKPLFHRIENSPIGYRLATGVFWSLAGTVISRGLTLVAMVLAARILGKAVFGELGMIQSTVGMFGTFAGFGLGVTATKHIAEFRHSDPERAGRILGLSGLTALATGGTMAIGLFAFAPWLAEHTLIAPHLAGALRIGVLILFLNALNGAQTGALAGFEAFKTIAYVNLLGGLLSFPIFLSGVYLGGLTGAVWALSINLCFSWLLNHLALRKEARHFNVPFTFSNCFQELSILWRFSLPAVLGYAMVGPVNWVCSAMLVNQPEGYGEMGVFNACDQWYTMLMFLPSLLSQVVLPVLSERLGQRDTIKSRKTLVLTIKASALITLPLVLLASIASPYIMGLYGEGFRRGWPTLVVVLFAAGLQAVITPVGSSIAAAGKVWVSFTWNMGWAITFILATVLLIHFGSLGLATAKTLSYVALSSYIIGYTIRSHRTEQKDESSSTK